MTGYDYKNLGTDTRKQLKEVFHRGDTHANPFYIGKAVEGVITSYDSTTLDVFVIEEDNSYDRV